MLSYMTVKRAPTCHYAMLIIKGVHVASFPAYLTKGQLPDLRESMKLCK